jgi:hypothetical protein
MPASCWHHGTRHWLLKLGERKQTKQFKWNAPCTILQFWNVQSTDSGNAQVHTKLASWLFTLLSTPHPTLITHGKLSTCSHIFSTRSLPSNLRRIKFDWLIAKKREKVGLVRHPQLINMRQNKGPQNKYPQFLMWGINQG